MSDPSIGDYYQLIAYLFSVSRYGGCKLGLRNMEQLNELMGFPHRSFTSIQVAGTNGKGSVTTKIAKSLQLAGYRVGCYTSPHISCFRERIQVNGVYINEREVEEGLKAILKESHQHGIHATFFELTTILAFCHFARSEVEIAVLETGLGGRLDATNVVTPLLSVITSISLDHIDILGPTREAIAREKGGIIKWQTPTVVGPMADLPVIREIAQRKESAFISVPKVAGDFDAENSAIARAALQYLSNELNIDAPAMEQGIRSRPPCRFEQVPKDILKRSLVAAFPVDVILDVGHNPDAIARLMEALESNFGKRPWHVVCGFSKGKNVVNCLKMLAPRAANFALIQANHERALPLPDLNQIVQDIGISPDRMSSWYNLSYALEQSCRTAAETGGVVVVCGSFFIMAEVRACLGYIEPLDSVNLNELWLGEQPLAWVLSR